VIHTRVSTKLKETKPSPLGLVRYMTMKSLFINLFCITVLSLTCGTNVLGSSEAYPCIPAHEVAIEGLFPGQSERVLEERPKPQEVKKSKGEDDGGEYTATTMKYARCQVVIVRETVDSVSTSSPAVIWVQHIKVGDLRSEIDRRIGYAKVADSKDETQYLVCSEADDVYAILNFSSDKLSAIEVVVDRP